MNGKQIALVGTLLFMLALLVALSGCATPKQKVAKRNREINELIITGEERKAPGMENNPFVGAGVPHPCAEGSRVNHDRLLKEGKTHDYCHGQIKGSKVHHVWIEVPTFWGHKKIDATLDPSMHKYNVIKRVRYFPDGKYKILKDKTENLAQKMQTPDVRDVLMKYIKNLRDKNAISKDKES